MESMKSNVQKGYKATDKKGDRIEQTLTDRQLAILQLVVNGLTEMAIASELKISLPTVKYHKKKT